MAAGTGQRLEVDAVLSFADELVGSLRASDDAGANARAAAAARMLRSACRSESDDLEHRLREYQEKMCSCKERICKAKAETIADDELDVLQNKVEENIEEERRLREELRAVHGELENLDRRRASVKERKDAINKKEKEMSKAKNTLSMCASVTNIIPDSEDHDKISS
ncbi:hypothetical protein BS78_06G263300 [Paspalum vaginatum]|nr:hypothetical protein BS78_06G263300 [Paspalum vaginatum]